MGPRFSKNCHILETNWDLSMTRDEPTRAERIAEIPWPSRKDIPTNWRARSLTYKYEMNP